MAIQNGVETLTIKYKVIPRHRAPGEKQEDFIKRPYRAIIQARNDVSLDAFAERVQIRTKASKQEIKTALDAITEDLIDLLANGDTIDLGFGRLAPSIIGSVPANRQIDDQNEIVLTFTPARGIRTIKAEASANVDTLQAPNIVAYVDSTTFKSEEVRLSSTITLTGHRLGFNTSASDEGVFAAKDGVTTKLNTVSAGETLLNVCLPEGFTGGTGVYSVYVMSRGGNSADIVASPMSSNTKAIKFVA